MTWRWAGEMKLTIFMRVAQRGQTSGSTFHTCLRRAAPGLVGGDRVVVGRGGRVVRGVGFGAATSGGAGIEAKVAGKVLSGVGDVLGELGDEVQGIEDLEVAADAAEEVAACGLGKALAVGLFGAVEDRALRGDADQALEAERTAQHVLGETFAAGDVVGIELHGEVDLEARVPPRCHLPDEGLVDLAV